MKPKPTMKHLPDLLVVTDRGHFIAYEANGHNNLSKIETMDMDEGLKKLSEQVTDKAGGFPASETNGHGNSAAERLPLQEELETRTFRKITQRIRDLLGDNRFETWGLVAPPEVNNAVIDALDAKQVGRLTVNLKLDLTGQPPDSLKRRLLAA